MPTVNELRKCTVHKRVRKTRESEHPVNPIGREQYWAYTPLFEGYFHQFGVDYDEVDGGPGMFTTAIVEDMDGNVHSVEAHLIAFHDRGE